jgi:DnaK suppressor protein
MSSHPTSVPAGSQIEELLAAIEGGRARAEERVRALERNLEDIVASSEGSPPDDEHDPEGATIAFERAQVTALLEQARGHLVDLDRAERSLREGSYGSCRSCGVKIAFDRLLARPATTTCVDCAEAG